jgi:hypothetical protein
MQVVIATACIVDNLMYVLHDLSVCIIISCFVCQHKIIVQERYPRYVPWCSYQADHMVQDNIISIGTHLVHHPNFKCRSKTNCSPIYHILPITLTMTKLELLSKSVLQIHINFPIFLTIFPDFLEQLLH